MSTIAFLVEQTAFALYIFIAIGVIWHFRKWVISGYELRATTFELERSYARERRANAFFALLLFAEFGLVIAGVQNVVAPTIREDRAVVEAMNAADESDMNQEAVADGVFATSTPPAVVQPPNIDASGVDLGDDPQQQIFIRPTETFTPVGTIEPNAPEVLGCSNENATLQIPANGMRVFQTIPVRGTAFWPEFSEFKLEIAGPQTLGQFTPWYVDPVPAEDLSTLTQFNPDGYEPGTYQFRLTVFDSTAMLVASCQVTIYISEPIPTATPLGN